MKKTMETLTEKELNKIFEEYRNRKWLNQEEYKIKANLSDPNLRHAHLSDDDLKRIDLRCENLMNEIIRNINQNPELLKK